jgi:solute:Na+ symporter, SSS family
MTGAQWIETQFGKSRGATLSHISVVVFVLISVIGFIAYAFKGIEYCADNVHYFKILLVE